MTPASQAAVAARGLGKTYPNGVTALTDLDLTLVHGEILAFLGRNGAGKSTTVRLLTTLTRPTAGTATVAGYDIVRQPAQVVRRIGVTMQDAALDPTMTGREHLTLLARLWGYDGAAAAARTRALLEEFGLTRAADRVIRTYSGGMRRRLDIAGAVLTRPAVLFLDEPTTGLDAQSRRALWERVQAMRDDGVAVFLTTQYLEEAEQLADRVAIVHGGRVAAAGTPDELRAHAGQVRRRARAATNDGLARLHADDRGWIVRPFDGPARALGFIDELRAHGVELASVDVSAPTLEDVYLRITGDQIEAGAPDRPSVAAAAN
jgi:ABC-2 type transport system ATP-binding protein